MSGAPTGNDNAKKAKIWSEALRKEITQSDDLPKLARALINKALEGDVTALKEIGDRTEGKVAQQTVIAGDQDNPINVTHGLSDALIDMLKEISAE
jgi:hypothetical protein